MLFEKCDILKRQKISTIWKVVPEGRVSGGLDMVTQRREQADQVFDCGVVGCVCD